MKHLFLIFLFFISTAANSQIISTIAGNDTLGFSGDGGAATAAKLDYPLRARPDGIGNVYIADCHNNRIRKISAAGIITTIAGNGGSYCCDGMPATAAGIGPPSSVAVDSAGNLYMCVPGVASGGPLGPLVRKVNIAGIITTFAGGGTGGDGIPATAAALNGDADVAVDKAGNVYICEPSGSIRKVDTAGIITTIAGNGTSGLSGDGGPATAAQLFQPNGVAADDMGNVYIADMVNNRIRKVDTAGIITTVAGDSTAGFSGDGGPATAANLHVPGGVAVDSTGNVYIADEGNARIRKITAGIITTIAGDSAYGHTGDGGPATAAELWAPWGVALDAAGNIYIADKANNDVRKVTMPLPVTTETSPQPSPKERGVLVYPNPATTILTIDNPITSNARYEIADITGRTILSGRLPAGTQTIDVNTLTPGSYIISMYEGDKRDYTKVFVKQ